MIKINDTLYYLNLIDILNELKLQLAIKEIYLFNQIKELPENIMVTCPFHKGGQERKPSCGIRKSDGMVHCFTCGETCSLEQLIGRCFGINDLGQFGLNWLKNNFLGDITKSRNFDLGLEKQVEIKPIYVSEEELQKYRFYHPYMYKRKMTDEVIEKFDIGYDKDTNCITFPVRDEDGNCLFIARRSVVSKFFNYPPSVNKPVYGLYELYQLDEFPKEIYICESMIDAITLWTHKKYAIALNGLGTNHQFEKLNKLPCRKFILATDNDKSGISARKRLRDNIKNKIVTEIVLPYNRKDINECDYNEIENFKEVF